MSYKKPLFELFATQICMSYIFSLATYLEEERYNSGDFLSENIVEHAIT